MVRSSWAVPATASAACVSPLTWPGGNPVTAVPGETPRWPLIIEGPVLVTAVPPRTPKLEAVPSPTRSRAATGPLHATTRARARPMAIIAAKSFRGRCGLREMVCDGIMPQTERKADLTGCSVNHEKDQ